MDDDAFLSAILDDPESDAPRLVYADWLDERGESDRAEFVRVQCALAKIDEADDRWPELRLRERQLLGRRAREWSRPLRTFSNTFTFRRGFADRATLNANGFLNRADE